MSPAELSHSQAWHDCFMHLPVAAFRLGADGCIRHANHEAARLLGLRAERLTRLCLAQFVAESERTAFFTVGRAVAQHPTAGGLPNPGRRGRLGT